ncbi:receptor kinase 3 isoform 1 [Dorcoceras hygrometricum]|uniref:Receptor-like serine/threonine-protein kinase n=1 Tax=Dorcoceras hygrometricum TaxID=472368 RepID=A0A2Z7AG07_9LAMI|nr:receptor kinase 3 isoform 1 [Dorcoceras hygrometricum]
MATLFWALVVFYVCVSLNSRIRIVANNILWPCQVLENGRTLTSANKRFELGFFNGSSEKDTRGELWYLGIWYRGIEPLTVVWVANRANPLRGVDIKLFLNSSGDLSLHVDRKDSTLIVNLNQPVSRPALVLLDSGNLVIKDGKNLIDQKYFWQSFNFPTDTMLPGMKIGWDSKSGRERVLTSWRTSKDPSEGEFVFRIGSSESAQLLLEKNKVTQSRWGPWNGHGFSGAYFRKNNNVFRPVYFHSGPEEVSLKFQIMDDSVLLRLVVNEIGIIQFLKWESGSQIWVPIMTLNEDICDKYGSCGPYGVCYPNGIRGCRCLKGFAANLSKDRPLIEPMDGCRRKLSLKCNNDDGFVKRKDLKLPDNFTVWQGLSPQQCGDSCLKDCSCMAYTNINIYGNGSKCVVWLDKLLDIRYSASGGDALYIRVARGELESIYSAKRHRLYTAVSILLLSAFCWSLAWCAKYFTSVSNRTKNLEDELANRQCSQVQDEQGIQFFDINTISAATNNFSLANKIGAGGFGPVYEGELRNGQRIAVKRLSEFSSQGDEEFQNELTMTASLHHCNLVELLGCCTEGDERILVYEYMPNKSLNKFIFDRVPERILSWDKRFKILKGIAMGLNHLHAGTELRIIHRDLKASNILLDDKMNPKIADFGLARNIEAESEAITRRVTGTYGYMSPEYVLTGRYSTKSDVFSFGVLLLEVISGRRNWGFQHPDHDFNLLGHAWKLWIQGKALELMVPALEESFLENEVLRCIQVGLLCVQCQSRERPAMADVVAMLQNQDEISTEPQEPGFYTIKSSGERSSFARENQETFNELTVTTLTGRS